MSKNTTIALLVVLGAVAFVSGIGATNFDLRVGGDDYLGKNIQTMTLDFATTSRGANDTLQLFHVPPRTVVECVTAECQTAEGGTFTLDVGDAASATRYLSNFNGNSAANWDAISSPTEYVTAGYIVAKLDHAVDAGKIKISAKMTQY